MKKILLLLLASISVVSCKKVGENEFIITGNAEGLKEGTEVYLNKQDSTGLVHVDTVKIKDGKFKFEGKITEPNLHFIQMKDIQGGFPFVLETGEIDMKVNKDTLAKSTVGGTYSNDLLADYSKSYEKINKKMLAFQKANMAKWNDAQAKKDTVTRDALIKQNSAFKEEIKKLSFDHIKKYPKSYLSLYFLEQFSYQPDADIKELKNLFDKLDPSLQKTKPGKRVKKNLALVSAPPVAAATTTGPAVGSTAPDFSASTPDGKTVSLKQSLGKATIIDFWASWCKPCRAENPNVVALYNEYHAKGLNIISVSLDKDAASWKEAIAADKLVWTNISNLKFWKEPIALQYDVQSIPATFLLDGNGKIVGKDLHGEALKAQLALLLKA